MADKPPKQQNPPKTTKRTRKYKTYALTEKQTKYAELRAANIKPFPAALQAGYSESSAHSKSHEIEKRIQEIGVIDDIRARNQAIAEKLGKGPEARIQKFVELTNAQKVVTASDKGIITDERTYDDGTLQLNAAKELSKLCGDYPAERLELDHKGGVVLMTNDDPLAGAFDITPED